MKLNESMLVTFRLVNRTDTLLCRIIFHTFDTNPFITLTNGKTLVHKPKLGTAWCSEQSGANFLTRAEALYNVSFYLLQ